MPKRTRPKLTRRDTLKGLGVAAASLAVACKGEPDDKGDDGPPLEGWDLVRSKIDTVVVLMMENRSFDHYFGAYTIEEGRTDIDGITSDWVNPDPDGNPVAWFRTDIDCLADPPHGWGDCHSQYNDGANDGFVTEMDDRHAGLGHEAMGYFNREDLPALYALADAFTLCDQYFCSVLGPTQPNRFYFHLGTTEGVTGNDVIALKQIQTQSIYRAVEEAGLSYGGYFANVPGLMLLPDFDVNEKHLFTVDEFFQHCQEGTLPNLVFVEPAYGRADDHPPAHPTAGQIFIAQIYEALAGSPQWDRMAFIVTYDEHGGFADHVPPPTVPDAYADLGFDRLGFRVPTVVAGPWVKPGHVSHVVYDHTSALHFVEELFELEARSERSAAADPMLDCFDLDAMAGDMPLQPIRIDPIEADAAEIYRAECVTDGNDLKWSDGVTGQPELEQYVRENLAGTRFDRIDRTDEIFDELIERAVRSGLYVPRPRKG